MDISRSKKKPQRFGKLHKFLPIYTMALPGLIYLIINNYVPMAGIVVAFKDYNVRQGIFKSDWLGLTNFKFLFASADSWIIVRNTLLYNLAFIIIGTIFALFISIMLNEMKNRFFLKTYQTVILLPYLISMVVVSYIVYGFLSMDTGLINRAILEPLGIDPALWYNEPKYWPYILVIVHTWKNFGFNTIVYYAAIIGISPQLYEAAEVDGASKIKQIFHITLPGLKPTIIVLTILAIGRIFYSDFGLFYQTPMNSGMLFSTTNVIDTYVYRALFQLGDIGMSSAAGVYQSVVGFILVLISNGVVTKLDKDNALF